ncbi:MAG: hypothetical protein AAGG08_18950, partial [Actinomycetota bacterium]
MNEGTTGGETVDENRPDPDTPEGPAADEHPAAGSTGAEDTVEERTVEEKAARDTEERTVVESAGDDPGVEVVGPIEPTVPDGAGAPRDLIDRLILSGAIAAVVVAAAVLRDVTPWIIVVAVAVAVAAFWAADHLATSRWNGPFGEPGAPNGASSAAAVAAAASATTPAVEGLPPVLDAGRLRDDSVDGADLATGRTHIYRVRLAPHGEPADGIAPAARIDARTASLAVAAPAGDASAGGESAAAAWCDRLVQRFTEAAPKPLSIASFDEWLDAAGDGLGSPAPPTALAGASIVTDRGSRVAIVMTVGDAAALVVSTSSEGPVVRAVVRPAAASGRSGPAIGLRPSVGPSSESVPVTWSTLPVGPGDRIVVASPTIADWFTGGDATGGDRRLELLDRTTAADIGAGLADERIAGRLADGAGAFAVVALAP